MKIGIIKELKSPPDRRVVFTPEILAKALQTYDNLEAVVEPSAIRIFPDQAYADKNITLHDDLTDCDVLVGVKEVPVEALIPNKTYFFFSHTIKEQEYNRGILQTCLAKNIRLIDHETLVDANNKRLIGFGRYAGIVGAYNTLRAFGIKYELFNLKKAEQMLHTEDLIAQLKKQFFPPIKIAITGNGKVTQGIMDILNGMKAKKVSVEHFLTQNYDLPVYTQLEVMDYYKRKDGAAASKADFYAHPTQYESNFERFSKVSDVLITGHFFKHGSPKILTRDMLNAIDNKIKVIGDVSCDVDQGPIDSTLRASTIADPFYGYHPGKHEEVAFDHPAAITVMAIDNLPCELPKDASEGFGEVFLNQILPAFFNNDQDQILARGTVTENGKLTERFAYLQDYVNGN